MSNVARMSDHASVAVSDDSELFGWARDWIDGLESGAYGQIRSLVVLVETRDGSLATATQSIAAMDRTRLVGLLTQTAHRAMDGQADIEDLRA